MDDYELAWDRILELAVVINDDMDRFLEQRGLTRARTHVLWVLHRHGPSTHKVLARSIGASAQNVTGLVDALAQGGFVTREPHPTDRRATLVTLSERGRTAAESMERDQRELTHELFSLMPDQQFQCLLGGLDTVLTRFKILQAREIAAKPISGQGPRTP